MENAQTEVNIEDIQQDIKVNNLIDDIKHLIYVNEVKPEFLELTALAILATATGDKYYTETEYGTLYSQIMYLMISPSGLGFKSAMLDKATDTITVLMDKMNKQTLLKYDYTNKEAYLEDKDNLKDMKKEDAKKLSKKIRKMEKEIVDLIAPDTFTSEALISYLTKHPVGLIKADEFSRMYKSESKNYSNNTFEILSKVYDGEMPKVATISRGIETQDKVNVSLMAGTTPFILYLLDMPFFQQGIGNRFLWVLELEKDLTTEEKNSGYLFNMKSIIDKEEYREQIVNKLYTITQMEKKFVSFNAEAHFRVIGEKVRLQNEATKIFNAEYTDVKASYLVRMMQNVLKIALLHYIGRINADQVEPQDNEINIDDVIYALDVVNSSYNDYIQMFIKFKELRNSKNVKSYADEFETLVEVIKAFGGICSISDIRRKKGWDSETITKIANQLVLDDILEIVNKKGKNGRDYIYYKILDKPDDGGERIDKQTTRESLISEKGRQNMREGGKKTEGRVVSNDTTLDSEPFDTLGQNMERGRKPEGWLVPNDTTQPLEKVDTLGPIAKPDDGGENTKLEPYDLSKLPNKP